jgi:hypothetical protein
MFVGAHAYMKGALYRGDWTFDLHIHPIARATDYGEAVHLREENHFVILCLRGTESYRELGHSKEVPVRGAGRIVDFAEQALQACPIARRQDYVQSHHVVYGEVAHGLNSAVASLFSDMMGHHGLCMNVDCHDEQSRNEGERQYT